MLALHPTTALHLERYIAAPSHAVLLTGAAGIGKKTIAEYIARQLIGPEYTHLADHPYVRFVTSVDGKAIPIESIRELEHFLRLKVPGDAHIKRIIIIENAQLLGLEAQNALLKTLEEPPLDTVIILTAPSAQTLLPTIQSRLQTIAIIKPSNSDLEDVMPSETFDSLYAICGGLPGLVHAMIHDESHPLKEAVATARQLLGMSSYERLLMVDRLSKDKQLALNTLSILQQMAHISLKTAVGVASQRWQGIMQSSYEAAEALDANGNTKLVLSNLLVKL